MIVPSALADRPSSLRLGTLKATLARKMSRLSQVDGSLTKHRIAQALVSKKRSCKLNCRPSSTISGRLSRIRLEGLFRRSERGVRLISQEIADAQRPNRACRRNNRGFDSCRAVWDQRPGGGLNPPSRLRPSPVAYQPGGGGSGDGAQAGARPSAAEQGERRSIATIVRSGGGDDGRPVDCAAFEARLRWTRRRRRRAWVRFWASGG